MKTPQVKPDWPTGIYTSRTILVPDVPEIIDDGTMDTVVRYHGISYRFDTDYRNTFDNDTDFLFAAIDQIEEELAQ